MGVDSTGYSYSRYTEWPNKFRYSILWNTCVRVAVWEWVLCSDICASVEKEKETNTRTKHRTIRNRFEQIDCQSTEQSKQARKISTCDRPMQRFSASFRHIWALELMALAFAFDSTSSKPHSFSQLVLATAIAIPGLLRWQRDRATIFGGLYRLPLFAPFFSTNSNRFFRVDYKLING